MDTDMDNNIADNEENNEMNTMLWHLLDRYRG
jgi:hypothetical protein